MAHRVFLSHAKEDQGAASRICETLEADGIGCWIAARDAAARKDKAAANLDAIRNSELVLLLFSASANASSRVLREIERAVGYEIPVLSVHLDDAGPNASLEYYLNLWQWLDASAGLEARREEIVAAVREQLVDASEAAQWRWLDAPGGVDNEREEILAAVRQHLRHIADSTTSQDAGSKVLSRWRPSRRTCGIIAGGLALVALALGLGLGLGLIGAGDHQGAWIRLQPAGTVPDGPTAPITYDSTTHRVILMVDTVDDGPVPSIVGTWTYDPVANTWSELATTGTVMPPVLGDFAMNYDPDTQRLIVFGGVDRTTELATGGWDNDCTANTWAFDPAANTWTDLKPSGELPHARFEGATAYDPASRRMILFGGVTDRPGIEYDTTALGDTWAYDAAANAWMELNPSGTVPHPCSTKMVYDSTSGRIIMFGGVDDMGEIHDDTWAYDPAGNTWSNLRPSGTLPPPRIGFGMAYDSSRRRVVIFGGCDMDGKFLNDSWAYDPAANAWTELKPSGALPRACISSLVYDEAAGHLLLFCQGGASDVILNDIWAFND